ncbi:MAG: 6-phosphogluconolactonase [Gammaproteobacteria bacterium]|nr:6-phosphogluconolactonase [Gammaproteobacteria bacterium]MBU1624466.1 6-phosphogluconolactonase [Gammaproteobacteria bacterium]MBU1981194.1 6-phosphogluconolactonase [Gammaproteobacteria bacterium]
MTSRGQFALPGAKQVNVYADAGALADAVAHRIAELVQACVAQQGVCRIALAGGGTPQQCYEKLRGLSLPWAHVHIYFGDERCLPAGDAQRNDDMAMRTLLQHVPVPAGQVHPMPVELGAVEAALRYAQELAQAGALDIVLLGMGEDGHTASLFPNDPALDDPALAVAVDDAPKPPPQRVSLGMAALNAARHKLFLVAGSGKRAALQSIAQGEQLPAGQVLDAEWFMDEAALPNRI